ncbi:MAG: DUF1003 domain-containing protein [Chitinophagaceae bacterium]|nr:MAG: DUF1003 domain-containing protein [Chitinophagaceae bacterium]
MNNQKLHQLLQTENEQLTKLNSIVVNAIEEEKLISQKLFEQEEKNPPYGGRIADAIATFGGSWIFILCFSGLLITWIILNLVFKHPFDPFPFILLNLFLSAVAALQAPIIMMSQNRKEEKDRERATSDYLVNLKSEIEVRNLHQKIDLLMSEQMQTLFEIQKVQMELMEDIKGRLRNNKG